MTAKTKKARKPKPGKARRKIGKPVKRKPPEQQINFHCTNDFRRRLTQAARKSGEVSGKSDYGLNRYIIKKLEQACAASGFPSKAKPAAKPTGKAKARKPAKPKPQPAKPVAGKPKRRTKVRPVRPATAGKPVAHAPPKRPQLGPKVGGEPVLAD